MINLISVFNRGGMLLWTRELQPPKGTPINNLIEDVLIEDHRGEVRFAGVSTSRRVERFDSQKRTLFQQFVECAQAAREWNSQAYVIWHIILPELDPPSLPFYSSSFSSVAREAILINVNAE